MKTIYTLLLLCITTLGFAQTQENKPKQNIVTVESISIITDTVEELKTINWEDITSVFSDNKDEDTIEMKIGFNHKKSKYNFKSSVTISGKKEDMEEHIKKAKKAVKTIIKLANKHNK